MSCPEVLTWDFVWEVADKAAEKDENGIFKRKWAEGHDSGDL